MLNIELIQNRIDRLIQQKVRTLGLFHFSVSPFP